MKFTERVKPATTVKVLETRKPCVFISSIALSKMKEYVVNCPDEIGWMGTATRDDNGNFIIHDTYLFAQDVHATTTEITPAGLASVGEEILSRADGMEIWNSLRMWGHSHVRMAVNPSGQDDLQMNTFVETGHDWFLRLICNKNGDMKIDLWDYKNALVFIDIPWVRIFSAEEERISNEIDLLEAELKKLQDSVDNTYTADIKAEMAAKVKKKGYTTINRTSTWQKGMVWDNTIKDYAWPAGTVTYLEDTTSGEEYLKKNGVPSVVGVGVNQKDVVSDVPSKLDNIRMDFWKYFKVSDIRIIAKFADTDELETRLWEDGTYQDFFSQSDLRNILAYSQEYVEKYPVQMNSYHY